MALAAVSGGDRDLCRETYRRGSSTHRRKVRVWQLMCAMAPALAPLCDVAGIAFQKCSFQLTWSTLEVTGVPWRYHHSGARDEAAEVKLRRETIVRPSLLAWAAAASLARSWRRRRRPRWRCTTFPACGVTPSSSTLWRRSRTRTSSTLWRCRWGDDKIPSQ